MLIQPFKVLVCGGREFDDLTTLYSIMDGLHEMYNITEVIHGDARGADRLADQWAKERGIKVTAYAANWAKHGKAAGPKRNNTMLKQKPHLVVAFPGGTGTADMVKKSYRHRIKTIVLDEEPRGIVKMIINRGKKNVTNS